MNASVLRAVRRKLAVLQCPNAASFDDKDANACTKVVAYLEDRKVRFLPIEHREALRTPGAPAWGRAFLSYLRQLRCPHATHTTDVASGTTRALLLCWLVDHAIGIEFEDRGTEANAAATAALAAGDSSSGSGGGGGTAAVTATATGAAGSGGGAGAGAGASDDAAGSGGGSKAGSSSSSSDIGATVSSLAKTLGITVDTADIVSSLQHIRRTVQHKLLPIAAAAADPGASKAAPRLNQQAYPAGLSAGGAQVDNAASVLRMLYLADLRALQDQVNSILMEVQSRTANPKTDSKLGKVGR